MTKAKAKVTLRGRQLGTESCHARSGQHWPTALLRKRKTGQAIRHNNEPQGEDKKKKKKKKKKKTKKMMIMKLYIYFLFLKNFCPSLADFEILSAW